MHALPRVGLARGLTLVLAVLALAGIFSSAANAQSVCSSGKCTDSTWASGQGTLSNIYSDQADSYNLKLDYDFGNGKDGDWSGGLFSAAACGVTSINGKCASTLCTQPIMQGGSSPDAGLIVKMQGTSAGSYQIDDVDTVSGGTICFKDAITVTMAPSDIVYVQRVPQYKDVSGAITGSAWQSSAGQSSGIIAFKAKGAFNANVNADGLGYGGGGTPATNAAQYQQQGESTNGPGAQSKDANPVGGGGGGILGGIRGSGGGGGGCFSAGMPGGQYSSSYPGGTGGGTYCGSSKLSLGSGGGGGGFIALLISSNSGGRGGRGGGGVIIFAKNIQGSVTIEAKGENGESGTGGNGCGGGAGSGGTAIVTSLTGTATVNVSGGAGGAKGGANGFDGGAGGNGYSGTGTASLYSSGSYISNVLDVSSEFPASSALWLNITPTLAIPAGGQIKVSYHICHDASCSGMESAWTDCGTFTTSGSSGKCDMPAGANTGNFLQYKLDFTKGTSATSTPSVNKISLQYRNSDSTVPNVWITGGTGPNQWSKADMTAVMHCSDPGTSASGCDPASYKLYYSASGTCPTSYGSYNVNPESASGSDTANPDALDSVAVTSSKMVCAAAYDKASNLNWNYTKYGPANFSIDKGLPTATVGNESATWIRSNNVTASCMDSLSGCQGIYYAFVPSQSPSCPCTGNPVTTGGVMVNSDHNDYLCICVRDNAGNEQKAVSKQLMVDATNPSTSNNADPSQWYGSNAEITISCSDALSGCSKIYYCIDNQGGTCTPTTAVTNTGTDSNLDATVQVSCPSGQQSCNRIIRYYAEDKAVNKDGSSASPKSTAAIKIDTSVPTCTMKAPTAAYTTTTSITVSWEAKPGATGGSPIASVLLEVSVDDGDFSPLGSPQTSASGSTTYSGQNGHKYSFQCTATDAKGASSGTSSAVSTTVKTGASDVQISSASGPLVNSTSFTLTWSSDETSVKNYTVSYMEGSGSWTTCKVFQDPNPPGSGSILFGANCQPAVTPQNNKTYSFKVRMMDIAGNSKDSGTITVKVDTGKPACTVSNLPAYQPKDSNSITVGWTGTDAESGVKDYIVEQRIGNGPAWTQVSKGPGATSATIENLDDGVYWFRCKAIDNAGNTGDAPAQSSLWKNTTVDVNPPEIAPIIFNATVDQGQNLTVRATVTDTIKVSGVALSYDGTTIPPTRNSTNANQSVWDVTWTISNLATTGLKPFRITVQDINGNENSTDYEFMVKLCDEGTTQKCGACGSGTKTCVNGNFTECAGADPSLIKPEVCNGMDDNCDTIIDNIGGSIDPQVTHCACTYQPESKIADIQARADDKCDGIDGNCNGQINEDGGCCKEGTTQPCANTKGACAGAKKTCTGGKWGECSRLPGQKDCSSNLDNDCNGIIDSQEPGCKVTCIDTDGDGYGSPASALCTYPGEDCNDNDPTVYPGAPPTCTGTIKDNNCDGSTADEEAACQNSTCANGKQDGNEEGVDCGGDCPTACFNGGWLYLTAGGIVILIILAVVWLHFRKQGRELTWEELKKKWTPEE